MRKKETISRFQCCSLFKKTSLVSILLKCSFKFNKFVFAFDFERVELEIQPLIFDYEFSMLILFVKLFLPICILVVSSIDTNSYICQNFVGSSSLVQPRFALVTVIVMFIKLQEVLVFHHVIWCGLSMQCRQSFMRDLLSCPVI